MRTLIENLAFAITVDNSDSIIKRASMVIADDIIQDIGPADEVAGRHDRDKFDDIIDGTMMGVCPGFVDSHVHLSETLSRAVFPDDIDTRTWVFHWAKPFYAHVNAEDELVGVFLGCAEMIRSGTTCLLDMGAQNDPAMTVSAMKKIGIRGITGRHAADNPPAILPDGWSAEMIRHHFFPSAQAALAALEETVDKWHNSANGRIRCWVNIEGKEPCSLDLHIGARELAETLGVGTTYHLATSIEEANICQHNHGKRPVQRIADRDGLGSNLVIAHGVALDDEECDAIARHNVKIAFCPGTSLKLAKGAAAFGRYPELMEAGVAVGLGTDGVSASGNLNLMRQLYVSAGLFKDARNDATLVGARKAIRMATIDGAKALNWDDEIGSLEVGKKADFILFNLNHVEWTPYYDPVQALVWSASSASIAQTWINGVAVFKDGKIQTIDEQEIFAEARKRSTRIIQRAGLSLSGVPRTTTLYS